MLLRVILAPDNIRRLQISENLESVDQLKQILKEKIQLQNGFEIQFEDPEFQNELCNLNDITELPPNKAVLKIIFNNRNEELPSTSFQDQASVPPVPSPATSSTVLMQRDIAERWPTPFPIPAFSYDVELRLVKGNEVYEKSKTLLNVSRDMRVDILDKIAQAVFSYKAYPNTKEIESVASAITAKYPCLKDPGPGTGYDGWTVSIKYKLGNYRSKLRSAGCTEVMINQRGDGPKTKQPFKRARRSEVNFLPDNPADHTIDSLEAEQKALQEEMKKRHCNTTFINSKMEITFSLRRKEIVEEQPLVGEVIKRWPGLFIPEQICAEFYRVTRVDLRNTFLGSLDSLAPRLIKLYRAKSGALGKDMQTLLDKFDKQTTDIVVHRKSTALCGLPLLLKEKADHLLRTCLDTDPEETCTKGLKVGVLTIVEDDVATVNSNPTIRTMSVVVEEQIVLDDVEDLPNAFAFLFGLIYSLNIEYPKEVSYTFEVIQKLFMQLGSHCSPKVLNLKNKLLRLDV